MVARPLLSSPSSQNGTGTEKEQYSTVTGSPSWSTLHTGAVTRERYKTPDTDVSAEFDRVCELFQQALPGPADRLAFECLMNEASSLGLNWVDGLQYVVDKRNRMHFAEQPSTDEHTDSSGGNGGGSNGNTAT